MIKGFLVVFLWITFFPIPSFCQKATLTGKIIYDVTPTEVDNDIIIELIGIKSFSTQPNQKGVYLVEGLDMNQSYTLIVRSINTNHKHYYFELAFPMIKEHIIIDIKLSHCGFNAISAQKDIENKQIKLLLAGSIAPAAKTKNDILFEKKYKIKYHQFGCESPSSTNCLQDYNKTIFAFLDKKYGRKWRKKVHDDVLFLD
jgi:hypothetical protein